MKPNTIKKTDDKKKTPAVASNNKGPVTSTGLKKSANTNVDNKEKGLKKDDSKLKIDLNKKITNSNNNNTLLTSTQNNSKILNTNRSTATKNTKIKESLKSSEPIDLANNINMINSTNTIDNDNKLNNTKLLNTSISINDNLIDYGNIIEEKDKLLLEEKEKLKLQKIRQAESERQMLEEREKFIEKELADKHEIQEKEKELSNLRKVINEKNDLQKVINSLSKKLEEEAKATKEANNLLSNAMRECERSSSDFQKALSVQKELSDKISELNSRISAINREKNELTKQYEDIMLRNEEISIDLELKNEEYEALKLEFEEYKLKDLTNKSHILDENSAQLKVLELEGQISALSNALVKVDHDKNKEIIILKKEIEKLSIKAKEAEEVPKRDEIIQILKDSITGNENTIAELKEQLSAYNSVSEMMDEIIIEKTKLEEDLYKEREEKGTIKYNLEMTELLVQELEASLNLSDKNIVDKENEIINLNSIIDTNRDQNKETEKQIDKYLKLISDLRKENKTIRNEISKMNNVNIEDILSKNKAVNSQLQSYNRQKVLPVISDIDSWVSEVKSNVLLNCIPSSTILNKEGLKNFDKIALVFGLRRKVVNLVICLIDSELLYEMENDDQNKDNNNTVVESSEDKYQKFIENLINLLNEVFKVLLGLELILISNNMNSKEYVNVVSKNFWITIESISSYINSLIKHIKEDTFSIEYNNQIDSFQNLFVSVKEEAQLYINNYIEENYTNKDVIPDLYSDLIIKISGICITFNKKFINYKTNNSNETITTNINSYETRYNAFLNIKNLIVSFKKLVNKIEDKINYNYTNLIKIHNNSNSNKNNEFINLINCFKFDYNALSTSIDFEGNSSFKKFKDISIFAINTVEDTNKAVDVCSKVLIITISFIEKLDITLEKEREFSKVIPIRAWAEGSYKIIQEFLEFENLKIDLDNSVKNNIDLKKEVIALKSNISEIKTMKEINDKKLAEATNQLGKIPLLEIEKEDYAKKIEKYTTTVDNLMSQLMVEQEKNKTLTNQLSKSNENQSSSNVKPRAGRIGNIVNNPNFNNFNANTNISNTNNENDSLSKLKKKLAGANAVLSNNPTSSVFNLNNSSNQIGTDSAQLFNTMMHMQRERKLLKMKLMKGKLEALEKEDSYINKFILQNKNLSENEEYDNVEDLLESINIDYNYSRAKLSSPTVIDLSDKKNNYEELTRSNNNNIKKLKINYFKKMEKVLFNLFGNKSIDKTFKDILDNEILKTLDYFGQKKLLIGKLRINNNNCNSKEQDNKNENKVKYMPLYLNESTLKYLNKTFMTNA